MNLLELIHDLIHGHPEEVTAERANPYQEVFRVYPEEYLGATRAGTVPFLFSPGAGYRWQVLWVFHRVMTNNFGTYRNSRLAITQKGVPGFVWRGLVVGSGAQYRNLDITHLYIPGGERSDIYDNYQRGEISVYSDRNVDDNDKTVTVPDLYLWDVRGISVHITTSAAGAARNYRLEIMRPVGDDTCIWSIATLGLLANQIGMFGLSPGTNTSGVAFSPCNLVSLGPLPISIWPPGYRMRVWDSLNISALDDIRIEIQKIEHFNAYSDITPIPRIDIHSEIGGGDELRIDLPNADAGDAHQCYIGVRESKL
jgi:hypothetical protein